MFLLGSDCFAPVHLVKDAIEIIFYCCPLSFVKVTAQPVISRVFFVVSLSLLPVGFRPYLLLGLGALCRACQRVGGSFPSWC